MIARAGLQWRVFLTCWMIYVLHFATDFAREHYLTVAIVDDRTFSLDKYVGFHPDIFEIEGRGAFINGNPGASMVAAVPYAIFSPVVNAITRWEVSRRPPGDTLVTYDDPRPWRVKFFKEARRSGLDVKFAMVGAVTLVTTSAPLSALAVVVMLRLLLALGMSRRAATWGALLFGLGTPMFFRTAYLNQNHLLAVFSFMAFALLWNPPGFSRWSRQSRHLMAGVLGGLGVLCDYSGGVLLLALGGYAFWRLLDDGDFRSAAWNTRWIVLGALGPVLLLWYYQYVCFGVPFSPPQAHMAPVKWVNVGYQGVGGLSPELLRMLLLHPKFGVLVAWPMLILAVLAPWVLRRAPIRMPRRELIVALGSALALLLFFSTVQYTRLLAITGVRYQIPMVPFLFLPAFLVLIRLPAALALAIALGGTVLSWCNAMTRTNEMISILGSVKVVFTEGLQLPWLTTLGRLSAAYAPGLQGRPSALPYFLVLAVVLWLVWRVERPWRPLPVSLQPGS